MYVEKRLARQRGWRASVVFELPIRLSEKGMRRQRRWLVSLLIEFPIKQIAAQRHPFLRGNLRVCSAHVSRRHRDKCLV